MLQKNGTSFTADISNSKPNKESF